MQIFLYSYDIHEIQGNFHIWTDYFLSSISDFKNCGDQITSWIANEENLLSF
jgi:hypothetical protein